MEVPNLDCYDVFNDYLGLSNVVGAQEDSYNLFVKSLLANELKAGGPSSAVAGNQMKMKGLLGRDANPPAPLSPKRDISDVERLFGRGATLQKTSPSAVPTTVLQVPLSTQNQALPSHNHRIGSIFSNQNRRMSIHNNEPHTAEVQGTTGERVHGKNCNANEDIELALDAILEKYNRLYSQQKPLQSFGQKLEDSPGAEWSSSAIASLQVAIAKAAGSNGSTQASFPSTTCNTTRFHGATESAFQTDDTAGGIFQNNSRFIGCSFCKNNKEVKEWFMSHQLKDNFGRVTCPVLRSYVCPMCDATGDNAHTIGHCPLNPDRRNSLPLAIRSKANATGKKKYP